MSQPNEVASNGPTQHSNNNKPDVQEGVSMLTYSGITKHIIIHILYQYWTNKHDSNSTLI